LLKKTTFASCFCRGCPRSAPNYLPRFASERVVTINTVATGGNTELLSLDDGA